MEIREIVKMCFAGLLYNVYMHRSNKKNLNSGSSDNIKIQHTQKPLAITAPLMDPSSLKFMQRDKNPLESISVRTRVANSKQ